MAREHAVEVSGLQAGYDNNIIIESMDLVIPKGEITMIIGSNGCGKSTLLKSVGRILPYKVGEVKINGTDIKKQASKELAKQMFTL